MRPRNRNRLIASAARKAKSSEPTTATPVTESEMPSAWKNEPSASVPA